MGTYSTLPAQVLSAYAFFKCTHFQDSMHYTHTHTHTDKHTHTHTQSCVSGQWNWGNIFSLEKGFQGRFKRDDRGRMADRNRELVPDSWSRVKERVLTTGFLLLLHGWYSEHLGVCKNKQKHTGFNRTTLNMHKCSGYTPSSSIGVGVCPTPSKIVGITCLHILSACHPLAWSPLAHHLQTIFQSW